MNRRFIAAACTAFVVVLAACGAQPTEAPPQQPTSQPPTAAVTDEATATVEMTEPSLGEDAEGAPDEAGEDGLTDAANATEPAAAVAAAPTELLPTFVPVTGEAPDVDVTGVAAGTFSARVGGATEGELVGAAVREPGDDDIRLTLTSSGGIEGAAVRLVLPLAITPGIYELVGYDLALDRRNIAAAPGVSYVQPILLGEDTIPVVYRQIDGAVFTLASREPLVGTFTFTASNDGGTAVTISGVFNAPVAR